jgi:hypothetical protein
VNALAYQACFATKERREKREEIREGKIEEVKEELILRRDVHIDQLIDKLEEERVRRVIEPILAGEAEDIEEKVPMDDIYYVRDLGLIKIEKGLKISNKIYQEVIPRELVWSTQVRLSEETEWYVESDTGKLMMDKLIKRFQEFFREHSEHWIERFGYKEAGPQLLMQAFLQRIVNGGGRIEREYALGRKRTDLLIIWPYGGGDKKQKVVIELKVLHKGVDETMMKGLEQTAEYMDKSGADEGHLIIFDKRAGVKWIDKVYKVEESCRGKRIKVWGM